MQIGPVNIVPSNSLSRFLVRTVFFETHLCLEICDKSDSKQLLIYLHACIYMRICWHMAIYFTTWPRIRNYQGTHQINIKLYTVNNVLRIKRSRLSDGISRPQWPWVLLPPKASHRCEFLTSWELELAQSCQATPWPWQAILPLRTSHRCKMQSCCDHFQSCLKHSHDDSMLTRFPSHSLDNSQQPCCEAAWLVLGQQQKGGWWELSPPRHRDQPCRSCFPLGHQ